MTTLDGVSNWNQVSVRAKVSIRLSVMNSCKRYGLSRIEVTEDADLMLRHANCSVGSMKSGPGLGSTLPDKRSNKVIKKCFRASDRLGKVN